MEKNKGGRPRHGDAVKSSPLSMRVEPNLRIMLQESADANGRSLTQEVEARLGASFGRRELQLLEEDVDEQLQQAMMANDTNLGEELNARLRRSFDKSLIAIPPHVADELEAVAKYRGLSIDGEAEERLRHSLLTDSFFGGSPTGTLLRMLGTLIDAAERKTGSKWHEDKAAWYAVVTAINEVMELNRPTAPIYEPDEAMAKRPAYEAAREEAQQRRAEYLEFIAQHPDLEETTDATFDPSDETVQTAMRLAFRARVARDRVGTMIKELREIFSPAHDPLLNAIEEGRQLVTEDSSSFRFIRQESDNGTQV